LLTKTSPTGFQKANTKQNKATTTTNKKRVKIALTGVLGGAVCGSFERQSRIFARWSHEQQQALARPRDPLAKRPRVQLKNIRRRALSPHNRKHNERNTYTHGLHSNHGGCERRVVLRENGFNPATEL
jgi:hypothetical protein